MKGAQCRQSRDRREKRCEKYGGRRYDYYEYRRRRRQGSKWNCDGAEPSSVGVGRLVREKAVDVEDLLFDRKINWRSLKSQGDPEGRGTFYFFF